MGATLDTPESRERLRAVWNILLSAYDDPAELPLTDRISDAWASYQAATEALGMAVGAEVERADAAAIAQDCKALAALVPAVIAGSREWPRPLCVRLLERLQGIPPTLDAVLVGQDVDVWPVVERLRATVCRPALWASSPIVTDLQALAVAMGMPMELPRRTKPHNTARDRLIEALRQVLIDFPPDKLLTHAEQRPLMADLLKALGIDPPVRL